MLLLQIPRVPLPVPLGGAGSTAHAATSAAAQAAPPLQMAVSMPQRLLSNERVQRKSSAFVTHAAAEQAYSGVSAGSRHVFSWPLAGLAIELAVALLLLARVLIGVYFANRLIRTSLRIYDPETLNLFSRICRAAGIAKTPRLAESAFVCVPVTLGIDDPAILLPTGWREWQRDEIAAVLTHEASHVARQDALIQRMALVHRAIFWFSPLAWWLERHLADLAEQASDEAALGAGADRARYAEALLGFFAELDAAPARVWWHGVAMAKAGQSEKRVERILAWRPAMPNKMSKSLAVAIVAICAPVAALAVSATPSPYSAQELSGPPAPQPPPPPGPFAVPVVPEPAPMALPPAPSAETPGEPPEIAPLTAVPALPEDPASIAIPAPKPQPQQPALPPAPPSPAPPPPPMAITPPASGWTGLNFWGWGPRFVIVSNGAEIVNGSEEDAELVRALRSKIHGDFLWFEQDGKSYVIRDQAIVDRAKKIWAPREDAAKLQHQMQEKERTLSEQMHEQVQQKMQEIRVKVPDMTAELQKLRSELKNLDSNGATLQQLGDLQREVGELQQALNQARWNSNMQEITRQAGELGQQMGELGRQIGEIARRQVEAGQRAGQQMRQLFDNAIASGAAKPE